MVPNTRNVEAHTSSNTTVRWHGATKPTIRLTHLGWKPRKTCHALMNSSVLIAKKHTKPTTPSAHSGNTGLTESSTQKKPKSSGKSEPTQSAQMWVTTNYEY